MQFYPLWLQREISWQLELRFSSWSSISNRELTSCRFIYRSYVCSRPTYISVPINRSNLVTMALDLPPHFMESPHINDQDGEKTLDLIDDAQPPSVWKQELRAGWDPQVNFTRDVVCSDHNVSDPRWTWSARMCIMFGTLSSEQLVWRWLRLSVAQSL